jgi:hypothetical protein
MDSCTHISNDDKRCQTPPGEVAPIGETSAERMTRLAGIKRTAIDASIVPVRSEDSSEVVDYSPHMQMALALSTIALLPPSEVMGVQPIKKPRIVTAGVAGSGTPFYTATVMTEPTTSFLQDMQNCRNVTPSIRTMTSELHTHHGSVSTAIDAYQNIQIRAQKLLEGTTNILELNKFKVDVDEEEDSDDHLVETKILELLIERVMGLLKDVRDLRMLHAIEMEALQRQHSNPELTRTLFGTSTLFSPSQPRVTLFKPTPLKSGEQVVPSLLTMGDSLSARSSFTTIPYETQAATTSAAVSDGGGSSASLNDDDDDDDSVVTDKDAELRELVHLIGTMKDLLEDIKDMRGQYTQALALNAA